MEANKVEILQSTTLFYIFDYLIFFFYFIIIILVYFSPFYTKIKRGGIALSGDSLVDPSCSEISWADLALLAVGRWLIHMSRNQLLVRT